MQRTTNLMAYLCGLIIALLPFHAFLTVWGSTVFGHYTLLRLWKEAILGLLLAGAASLLIAARLRHEYRLWPALRSHPIVLLVGLYAALLTVAGLSALMEDRVTPKALAYGVLIDTRFLLFLLITWLVSRRTSWIVGHWRQLVLLPAVVVILFGIMQATVLPADFLRHFGYGPDTIRAVQVVDQKADYQRIASTLRGANQLGAYLVLIIAALAGLVLRTSSRRWLYVLGLTASSGLLVMTFSRSALLGAVAAISWLVWQSIGSRRTRKLLALAAAAALILFALTGYLLRDNNVFQNTILHTDENSASSLSSNAGHVQAAQAGVQDIIRQPFGRGVGTAGPASVYNAAPARIAENYYLQIGQEAGLAGILLFVAINLAVAWQLWQRRKVQLAQILLASLLGLSIVNLLLHGWADDTLSYMWWGLAGAVIGANRMTAQLKAHDREI